MWSLWSDNAVGTGSVPTSDVMVSCLKKPLSTIVHRRRDSGTSFFSSTKKPEKAGEQYGCVDLPCHWDFWSRPGDIPAQPLCICHLPELYREMAGAHARIEYTCTMPCTRALVIVGCCAGRPSFAFRALGDRTNDERNKSDWRAQDNVFNMSRIQHVFPPLLPPGVHG